MNYLHSFKTKSKLELHIKVFENKDLYGVVIPSEDTKILEFIQHQNSDKTPSIIYADLNSVIKKVDECKNNLGKSSITKVGESVSCRN